MQKPQWEKRYFGCSWESVELQVSGFYICVAPGGFEGRFRSCAHTHTEQTT